MSARVAVSESRMDSLNPFEPKRKKAHAGASSGVCEQFVADGEGFEPPRRLPACWFSRPVPSTTRPPIPCPIFPPFICALVKPYRRRLENGSWEAGGHRYRAEGGFAPFSPRCRVAFPCRGPGAGRAMIAGFRLAAAAARSPGRMMPGRAACRHRPPAVRFAGRLFFRQRPGGRKDVEFRNSPLTPPRHSRPAEWQALGTYRGRRPRPGRQ